jgi:hypothetical protein
MGGPLVTATKKWRTAIFGLCCILAAWTQLSSATADCAIGNSRVTSCLSPITDLEGHIGLKFYTATQLDGHCNDVVTAFACLKTANCEANNSATIKTKYAGIEHAFKYLCGAGKAEYLSEGDCWSSINLRNQISECERENQVKTQELGTPEPSNYQAKCKLDNNWVDCINDAVEIESACDEAASEVAKLFAIRSLEPVSEVHGCHLAEEDDSDTDEHTKDDDDDDDGASCIQLSVGLGLVSLLLSLAV